MSNLGIMREFLARQSRPSIYDGLFAEQTAVLNDPAKRIVVDAGRRSGKTVVIPRRLIKAADENPQRGEDDSLIAYCAPTLKQAKKLMWSRIQMALIRLKRPCKVNNTELELTFPNGCRLWIMGLDNDKDVQKLRGYNFRLIAIDEAGALNSDTGPMVEEVIEPALSDYGGALLLAGTPKAICSGYFYDACKGNLSDSGEWSHHHWNITSNKYFPQWVGKPDWQQVAITWLTEFRAKKHWDVDNPTYQREWLGQWVRDADSLVYHFEPTVNIITARPDPKLPTVMGVDLGQTDPFVCRVWAFDQVAGKVYGVDHSRLQDSIPTFWAQEIKRLQTKWKPMIIVADAGALGKAIVDDLNYQHGLGIIYAHKEHKGANIEILNGDLRQGNILVYPGDPVIAQWESIEWDEDRKHERPEFPNDQADAALYGYMECLHWIRKDAKPSKEERAANYITGIERDIEKQMLASVKKGR